MIFKVMLFHLDNIYHIYHEKVVAYIETINSSKLLNGSISFPLREGGLNFGTYAQYQLYSCTIKICSKQIIRFSARSKSGLYLVF